MRWNGEDVVQLTDSSQIDMVAFRVLMCPTSKRRSARMVAMRGPGSCSFTYYHRTITPRAVQPGSNLEISSLPKAQTLKVL